MLFNNQIIREEKRRKRNRSTGRSGKGGERAKKSRETGTGKKVRKGSRVSMRRKRKHVERGWEGQSWE